MSSARARWRVVLCGGIFVAEVWLAGLLYEAAPDHTAVGSNAQGIGVIELP
jgi:hypothetical protein